MVSYEGINCNYMNLGKEGKVSEYILIIIMIIILWQVLTYNY